MRVCLLLLLHPSAICLLRHLCYLALGTPHKLSSIRDSHRVHHELDVTSVHSFSDLVVFRAIQHILRRRAVQVNVNCSADHVLHCVGVGMYLLRVSIEQFVALFVFEFLSIFLNNQKVSSGVQICLDRVPHCHCNLT